MHQPALERGDLGGVEALCPAGVAPQVVGGPAAGCTTGWTMGCPPGGAPAALIADAPIARASLRLEPDVRDDLLPEEEAFFTCASVSATEAPPGTAA
jgi:hypothetical protein